jgi:hypothetical protein
MREIRYTRSEGKLMLDSNCVLGYGDVYKGTLKVETARSFERSMNLKETIRCYVPRDKSSSESPL